MATRVTVSYFVNIGQTVAQILGFYFFPKWRPLPSLIFENSNSYTLIRLRGRTCITVLNSIKIGRSVAEIWRFFYFSRWRPSAVLNFEKCDFYGSIQSRVPMGFTTSNLVEIDQTLRRYGDLKVFETGGRRHLEFSKVQISTCRYVWETKPASLC